MAALSGTGITEEEVRAEINEYLDSHYAWEAEQDALALQRDAEEATHH